MRYGPGNDEEDGGGWYHCEKCGELCGGRLCPKCTEEAKKKWKEKKGREGSA